MYTDVMGKWLAAVTRDPEAGWDDYLVLVLIITRRHYRQRARVFLVVKKTRWWKKLVASEMHKVTPADVSGKGVRTLFERTLSIRGTDDGAGNDRAGQYGKAPLKMANIRFYSNSLPQSDVPSVKTAVSISSRQTHSHLTVDALPPPSTPHSHTDVHP
ncbi:hypothetical protein IW261DRAFT_1422956 [Armillaria novae-zelandiae]|uniref:Uncharacterized protein n=1 Tax=Armillaria novae-zelandiae TaxID=153914 RepID=A0AA39T9P0_9AGAR|nr:hypothetical protein IW261DRAFT_1422956 [Armillaria novae-zelandiae]